MKFLLACFFVLFGFFEAASQSPDSLSGDSDYFIIGGDTSQKYQLIYYAHIYSDTLSVVYGITEYTVSASDNAVSIISIDGEWITGWYAPADQDGYDELVQAFRLQYTVGQWYRPGECVLHTLLGDFRIYDHSEPFVPKTILVSEGKNGFIWFKKANDQVLRWDIEDTFKY